MKKMRFVCLILVFLLLLPVFSACGEQKEPGLSNKLSFKSASGYDSLKALDGQTVEINGYMATSSPADGSFIFLMNLPFQSCPFCKPNTSQLSNTLEVYPKKNSKFAFTNQAIKIVGTLEVSESVNKPFTDAYGYEFTCKIVDAEYTVLKDSDLSAETALWQKIANSDVINDVYSMFEYLNFTVNWAQYTMEFDAYTDYLWPSDALTFLETDGMQFNYGYRDGYFDDLIAKIRKIDPVKLEDLVAIVEEARALAQKGIEELKSENYRKVPEYTEKAAGELVFGDNRTQYRLNDESLAAQNDEIYYRFTNWLGGWEL